jgi:hypothetical protein
MLSEQNEKIVEFGIGGLCNYCLGRVGLNSDGYIFVYHNNRGS